MSEIDTRKKYGPCEERTVLLMGRTQTGKSTIAEVLATTLYTPRPLSIYSDTRRTVVKKFFTTDQQSGISYRFTIIDTPGLFDIRRDDNLRLKNQDITDNIRHCMKSNVRHAHLIGIVFNLTNGINQQDIETMIDIQHNFPQITNNAALIITNSEHLKEKDRKRLCEEFFQHRDVQRYKLKEFFKQGVLFMGCLRLESLNTVNEKAVYLEYNNVLDMRTAFIEKTIQCKNTVSFNNSVCPIM
jgi:GTPase Era involved in 16S rRNA processing